MSPKANKVFNNIEGQTKGLENKQRSQKKEQRTPKTDQGSQKHRKV